MAANDICAEIAALLNLLPSADETEDDYEDDGFGPRVDPTLQERDELAGSLRLAWSEGEEDPLLSTLDGLRRQRVRLEEEMRLLIAYGRRFTHPRPYKLIDLANAAGMSISGVRTAYESGEIDRVAEILGRQPKQGDRS